MHFGETEHFTLAGPTPSSEWCLIAGGKSTIFGCYPFQKFLLEVASCGFMDIQT
ncbi:hypothetical protein Bca4012_038990 [Brassica carinata]